MKVRIQYNGCHYIAQEKVPKFILPGRKWKTMSIFHLSNGGGILFSPLFDTAEGAEQAARDELRYREGMRTVKEFFV